MDMLENLGFVLFEDCRKNNEPWISIRCDGRLGVSAGVVRAMSLSRYKFVEMFRSQRDGASFALRFLTQRPDHDSYVTLLLTDTQVSVAAKPLLAALGVKYREIGTARRIPVTQMDEKRGLLTVRVPQNLITSRSVGPRSR